MKVGIFGGIILLILTLVFSFMAIQNNKIARQITINSFNLNKQTLAQTELPAEEDMNASVSKKFEDRNSSKELKKPTVTAVPKQNNWQNFDEKFKGFDNKFKNF